MARTLAIGGNRRTTELLLLLAAAPIVLLLFGMYVVNSGVELSLSSLIVPIGLVTAFLISHAACRILAPNADPVLLPLTFLLSGIGITFVLRLTPNLATTQIALLFVGIALMMATLIVVRRLDVFAHYKYIIGLAGIVLLLLPALVGTEISGSKIWLQFAGYSMQPGEFAKVLIVIFLASYLSENRELLTVGEGPLGLPSIPTLLPLFVMWGVAMAVMIFERDLGSAVLVFGTFVVMLYAATGRKSYVFISVLLLVIGGVAAFLLTSHVKTRFLIWLDPFAYAESGGYQLVQAIYSMADGGLFGTGIGRGYPTLIPVVQSDFIFAAIAEEAGLLGASGVLIAFFLFAVRGFVTAARAKSDITSLMAIGLTTSIALQAFVIVGGNTRVIPLTGVTLPFMSQGGTSLLASFIILALLLRAGDQGVAPGSTEEISKSSFASDALSRTALTHRLNVVTVGFALLFCVLIAALTYTQVIRAEYYQGLASNNHTIARIQTRQRGNITTSDDVTLATSVKNSDGTYSRTYPQGTLAAHVVGYSSSQYGSSGVELSAATDLAGETSYATWEDAVNALAGVPVSGNNVQLTIDSTVQEVAEDALEGLTGAIVVMDPETGAVLAEASSPAYDPNDIEDIVTGATAGSSQLYNRATQALYAPGSSFKVLTLAAALESGEVTPDSEYDSPASIEIGGADVTNFNSESHGTLTVEEATWYSSNTVFAQIAAGIGANALVSSAEAYGFNSSSIAQDFSITASLMPVASEMTEWETAWAGVGQPVGEHESPSGPQATVMQMALVAAAVANDGVIMRPYLIQQVSSPEGKVIKTTSAQQYSTVMSAATAEEVRSILLGAVEEGTGSAAEVSGTTVAGKTGTAEVDANTENAWFIGMAPADDPKVVVAVIIEGGGQGGTIAAPKAADCIEAALEAKGML